MTKIKNFSRPIVLSLSILIASLIGGLALPAALAWVGAPTTPPGQNVDAPLNIGPNGQAKSGGLILNTGGATNGLIVDKGNVGIGTTSPKYKLDIVAPGTNDSTAIVIRDSSYNIRGAWNIESNGGWSLYDHSGDTWHKGLAQVSGNVGIGTTGPNSLLTVGAQNASVNSILSARDYVGSGKTMVFSAESNTAGQGLFVKDNGNVGIGTTNPGSWKLYVNGGNTYTSGVIRADGGFQVDGKTVIDNNAGWHRAHGNAGFYFQDHGGGWYMTDSTWIRAYNNKPIYSGGEIRSGNDMNSPIYYDLNNTGYYVDPASTSKLNCINLGGVVRCSWPSGNITGSGSENYIPKWTSSSALGNSGLHQDNSSALYWDSSHDTLTQMIFRDKQGTAYGRVYGSGNGANFGLLDGDGNWSYLAAKDNYTQFRINNSAKMTIKSNGNVGIGTTGPSGKLDVRGSTYISAPGTNDSTAIFIRDSNNVLRGAWNVESTGANSFYDYVGGSWHKSITLNQGNVGIGTTNPGYKLDVASGGGTTARFGTASTDVVVIGNGDGKLTVGTIDPVYNISGEKFATYGSAMTGVKEETTGNVNLKCQDDRCVSVIDFDKQEKGSDLRLFYQITDFGKNWQNLVVLLSPEGKNNVWYELKPQQHQLLIYGEKEGRTSYRLTAPRFDHEKWPNINSDESVKGMKVEMKNK